MIRNATPADIPWILYLARAMWNESQYAQLHFSDDKVRRVVHDAITGPRGIAVLSENGFLIGGVKPHWAADDLVGFEYGLYVAPENRNGREAIQLIKAYTARARALGARRIAFGITTGVEIDRTERFYERIGFTRVGANFVKEI